MGAVGKRHTTAHAVFIHVPGRLWVFQPVRHPGHWRRVIRSNHWWVSTLRSGIDRHLRNWIAALHWRAGVFIDWRAQAKPGALACSNLLFGNVHLLVAFRKSGINVGNLMNHWISP